MWNKTYWSHVLWKTQTCFINWRASEAICRWVLCSDWLMADSTQCSLGIFFKCEKKKAILEADWTHWFFHTWNERKENSTWKVYYMKFVLYIYIYILKYKSRYLLQITTMQFIRNQLNSLKHRNGLNKETNFVRDR